MQKHKLAKRILSMFLLFTMMFTMLPMSTVLAADDINHGGGNGNDGNASNSPNVWIGEEGIRVTLLWVPLQADGKPDWTNSANIEQIGKTVDLRSPKYYNLNYKLPKIYGNFTEGKNSARAYRMNESFDPKSGSAYNNGVVANIIPGKTWAEYEANVNNGAKPTLKFPILFTEAKNNVDPLDYFRNVVAQNEILYKSQMHIPEADRVQYVNLASGMLKNDMGVERPGQFIEILESVLYGKNRKDGSFAYTLREIIRLANGGSTIYTDLEIVLPSMANSLYIKQDWPMLNLWGATGRDNAGNVLNNGATNRISSLANSALIADQKFGVGIVEFTTAKQVDGLPVIKYFYDFTSPGLDSTAYFDKATNTKSDPAGSTYTAKTTEDGYTLYGASVLSKSQVKGNLLKMAPDPAVPSAQSTLFKNAIDGSFNFTSEAVANITKKSKAFRTQDVVVTGVLAAGKANNWGVAHGLNTGITQVVSVTNNEITVPDQILKVNADGSISYNSGKAYKDLQLALLYVKGDHPEITTEDIPDEDILVYIDRTNVTKMFFEVDPVTKVEKHISSSQETIVKNIGHTIEQVVNGYDLAEWVKVPDLTPNVPESYYPWDDVKANI